MQTITADDYQTEEFKDTAIIIEGKVYRLLYATRSSNPSTIENARKRGLVAASFAAMGSRSDLLCHLRQKLDGTYIIERRERVNVGRFAATTF